MLLYDYKITPPYLRSPCWRWNVALEAVCDPNWKGDPNDRELTVAAAFYRNRSMILKEPRRMLQIFGPMYEAYLLNNHVRSTGGYKWLLEAFIVAGATNTEIARHVPAIYKEDTIEAYRKIYYDIEDILDSDSALLCSVISTAEMRHNRDIYDMDYTWKLFAREFGVDGLDALIKFRMGRPLHKQYQTWLRQMTRQRIEYNGVSASDVRSLYQENAREVLKMAVQSGILPEDTQESVPQQVNDAIQQILGTAQALMLDPSLEEGIQGNSKRIEPRLDYDYTILENVSEGIEQDTKVLQ